MKNKNTLIIVLILVIVSLTGFIIYDKYVKSEILTKKEITSQININKKTETQEDQLVSDEKIITNYLNNKGYGKSRSFNVTNLKLNNKFIDNMENDNISLYTGVINSGCSNVNDFCGGPGFVAVISENTKSVIYSEDTLGDYECKEIATIKNENVRNYVLNTFCKG